MHPAIKMKDAAYGKTTPKKNVNLNQITPVKQISKSINMLIKGNNMLTGKCPSI